VLGRNSSQPSSKEIDMSDLDNGNAGDPKRRDILRGAGAAVVAGVAGTAPASGQSSGVRNGNRDNMALGRRLQGVQHFGLTVQNMERAFEFYT
jgi:hypothetical protein